MISSTSRRRIAGNIIAFWERAGNGHTCWLYKDFLRVRGKGVATFDDQLSIKLEEYITTLKI